MNYASKILAYLGEGNRFSQVLLVAGAPPVEKAGTEFKIIINAVFTADDIRDTLAFFASNVRRSGSADLGNHGVFAFGMAKLGRFKVHYLTQRGSVFVSIQRMTDDIPELKNLLAQSEQMLLVEAAVNQAGGGIVIFTSSAAEALSRLIYSVLDRINKTQSKVIYVLEQNLSYLLRHRNSVSIQVEVGTDVVSLSEGIQNGLFLAPDLVYVRDPKSSEEYAGLQCLAEAGALVLISLTSISEQHLVNDLKGRLRDDFQALSRRVRKIIKVSTAPSGMLSVKDASGILLESAQ